MTPPLAPHSPRDQPPLSSAPSRDEHTQRTRRRAPPRPPCPALRPPPVPCRLPAPRPCAAPRPPPLRPLAPGSSRQLCRRRRGARLPRTLPRCARLRAPPLGSPPSRWRPPARPPARPRARWCRRTAVPAPTARVTARRSSLPGGGAAAAGAGHAPASRPEVRDVCLGLALGPAAKMKVGHIPNSINDFWSSMAEIRAHAGHAACDTDGGACGTDGVA
eukprot:360426-Chlamydomonas_euryale.AAC.1